MRLFGNVIRDCRRAEFKAAKALRRLTGQQTIQGSRFLLWSNRGTLKDTDRSRLDALLAQNRPLSALYTLKEQLQRLWHRPASPAAMAARLDDWSWHGTRREDHRSGKVRQDLAVPPHRHPQPCRSRDHHRPTRGRQLSLSARVKIVVASVMPPIAVWL